MDNLDIIDHHDLIRETVGYNTIKEIDIFDLPYVMEFLKIVNNYQKMNRFIENNNG